MKIRTWLTFPLQLMFIYENKSTVHFPPKINVHMRVIPCCLSLKLHIVTIYSISNL